MSAVYATLPELLTISHVEAFWEKVQVGEGCWNWQASVDGGGYGTCPVKVPKTRQNVYLKAHRFSWLLQVGGIPHGLWVLHKCDNRRCVNPEHLFLGTSLDNVTDMIKKGRDKRRGVKGEEHYLSKLTPNSVCEIRSLYAKGHHSQRSLAKEFCVSRRNIRSILNRNSWGHLE